MKIGVVGGNGMLGKAMVRNIVGTGNSGWFFDLPDYDILKCSQWLEKGFDWVVNCAAYTAVDNAEDNPTDAYSLNAVGAGRLARRCREIGTRLLHVSTDYVFDGSMTGRGYMEFDAPVPMSVYGASKLLGEELVVRECPTTLIVRTQSLFGLGGANFVNAILRQVDSGKKELKVVGDQVTCPTYVGHLAAAMIEMMKCGLSGIMNASAEGQCTWHEFAEAILKEAKVTDVRVLRVRTGEYPVKAARPPNSVLDKELLKKAGILMPTWEEGLSEYLKVVRV